MIEGEGPDKLVKAKGSLKHLFFAFSINFFVCKKFVQGGCPNFFFVITGSEGGEFLKIYNSHPDGLIDSIVDGGGAVVCYYDFFSKKKSINCHFLVKIYQERQKCNSQQKHKFQIFFGIVREPW